MLLALDLGTRTGWAIGHAAHVMGSGEEDFGKRSRYEGGGMRFLRFSTWLDRIHQARPFDQVVFEEVRGHKGVDAAHIYGGLLATLSSWCEHRSIPYLGVPVGEIKRHATGKGNSGKELVIAAMVKRGHATLTAKDDNEADALAILYWAFDHAVTSTPHQRHAPDRPGIRRVPLDSVALDQAGGAGRDGQDAGRQRRSVRRKG